MRSRTTAIGGALCLLLVPLMLLTGCGGDTKKPDASKVQVNGKLSSEQCQQVQSALSTLDRVPSGSVPATEASSASTTMSSVVGSTSVPVQTVLLAVNSLAQVPAEQLAATVSTMTSGGGYATALGHIHEAVDHSCT